jgi:hypothetical protein
MIESMSPTAGTKHTNELTITPASATNVIYAAISSVGNNFTLTATKGANAVYSIGMGLVVEKDPNTCGTITIGDTQYYDGTTKTWTSEELENALKAETFTWPANL